MFSVSNANLLTDMGKTIVRRHLTTTDAQSVWREFSEHMRTSSMGATEKRRLTQYVINTVVYDNFRNTTELRVLHFNEITLKALLKCLYSTLMSNFGNWMRSLKTVRSFTHSEANPSINRCQKHQ